MKFTKMHGAGNDFIIINNMEEKLPIEGFNELAKKLCHRRFSIGADGLMVVEHPSAEVEDRSTGYSNKIKISSTEGDCARTFATNIEARATNAEVQNCDFRMLFYNADGSVGEMCGNGARCIARYGYEHGLAEKVQRIETLSGIVEGQRVTDKKYKVRLNPVTKMDLDCVEIQMPNLSIQSKVSYVELGNPGLPHAVVECKGLQNIVENLKLDELKALGKRLRNHEAFPKGANVNFYEIIGEDELYILTYERGVEDFTLACGTGTASTVAVLTKQGVVSGNGVGVHAAGGNLEVDVVTEKSETAEAVAEKALDNVTKQHLYLTGEAEIVAEGEILHI